MSFLADFPKKEELLSWYQENGFNSFMLNVNAHVHTPYSFSAFEDIPEIFKRARKEGVRVLGINDFYSTDGYNEFFEHAVENIVFPLFNIEFIGMNYEDQKKGIRANDPSNPGRIYFSGKGLAFPGKLDEPYASQLKEVKNENLKRMGSMVDKVNDLLISIGSDIRLDIDEIFEKYAKDLVRERHIAKAIRIKVSEKYPSGADQFQFYKKLYSGNEVTVSLTDNSAMENEIRGMLLKSGKKAFVEEDPKAFLDIKVVKEIILNAGGIPTYPLLADDKNGNYTRFEQNKEVLLETLTQRNVHSIEFIPGRNDFNLLKDYVRFFWEKGIVVTFGTEHNSPDMIPMTVNTRGGVALDDELKEISFKGSCVVAAHQYLVSQGEEGYVDENGVAKRDQIEEFVVLGQAVMARFFHDADSVLEDIKQTERQHIA